jgi:Txe/YoeB family toxin of toxin-antitoxin system
MVTWEKEYTTAARRDARQAAKANLKEKIDRLIAHILEDPYRVPPPLEKLVGKLAGLYSRRINIQHRLVYEIDASRRTIVIHRMFSHYE